MGKGNFTEEFKRDAVAQITERGYPVAEVSKRLGVSQHSAQEDVVWVGFAAMGQYSQLPSSFRHSFRGIS